MNPLVDADVDHIVSHIRKAVVRFRFVNRGARDCEGHPVSEEALERARHGAGKIVCTRRVLRIGRCGKQREPGGVASGSRVAIVVPFLNGRDGATFNLPPPAAPEVPGFAKDGGKNVKMKDGREKNVVPVSTAEYNCSNWKWWFNNTTVTLGMQNVFDFDPPFVAGSFENGYDESLNTIKGRFWYAQLKKRF